ncbi:hypothetical protein [Streptomyces sp. TLI_185]|uniref:hypothetical protein n=1 Tax=Streptomyces sp. TLI_185 TaxID=2485151 RepID=UPI000F4D61B5|nr:hypothetical protein [Streptomyces sp. TLI_185]RPF35011.1 hypothetical protein EDD92_5000 [Streptomyces sp. TLI_185]
MTQHVRNKERESALGASADTDVPGRDVTPGRGGLLELLGLTLVAGAGVLFVLRPEFYEAGVHLFATRAASLVH